MRERRVEREALVGASVGEEGFWQGPPALAGGMDIGGQMDLDNRSDFPELGKTGGVMTVGGGVCVNVHGFGVEEERGMMAMATPKEDCMQEGGGDVDDSTLRNGPKRWASVVAGSSKSELEGCLGVTVDKTGGEPTVVFPAEAYKKMEDQYRFAAVAGFYGGRSSTGVDYRYVFQTLRKLWMNVNRPTFSVIGNGRFLVRVNSEEELKEVLSRKWVVGGRFLIASRWKPGTEMRLLEEESIHLWIRLPQLPVLFWNSYSFKAIAQGLGASFVRADECTMHRDKLGFARLCIDVPLNFKPVPKIKIEARENKISQEVIYESKVRLCRVCGTTSHYEEACKNKTNDGTPTVEEQAWNKVLVIKKDGGGFHRNGSGAREPQANRFAIFGDQLDKSVGNDSLTDRQLETRPYRKFEDGGSTSKQQKEVRRAGEHESKKNIKKGTKGGKDMIEGQGEARKNESIEKHISNPFLSLTQTVTNGVGDQGGPSRFMFVAGSKESLTEKEKDGDSFRMEGPERDPDNEGHQMAEADVKQRLTRKSTRFASKGKKGRPPATLVSLEDALAHKCYGTKKRKKVTDNMSNTLVDLPQREVNDRNENGRVLETDQEEMQASYVVTNHNWVGVSFRRLTDNKVFVVFGVYLPPRFGEMLQSLYQLEALVSRVDGPVLLIGDFNAMLSSCNKSGSAPLAASCISFSRFIYACRLKEVEDTNKKFTWSNHRQGQDSVQCKLDWCLVNNEWQIAFGGEGSLKVQTSASSDHNVLLYQIRDTIDNSQGKKPFRFFKPWLMSKEGKEVMLDAWRGEVRGCPMMRLLDFEYFAGMKVNKQKSEIFVRTMVDCHMLEIQRILQWPNGDLPSEYLGLPLFLGNLTEDLCLPLLTKVEKRLAGWKARILSYAGRVDTVGSGTSGMTINIGRAHTRHGPRIAGLSYEDNGQLGCAVIIKDRGRIHEGEMEVLERILRFHKEYGGDYIIISPTKEWANNGGERKEVVLSVTVWDVPMRKLLPNLDGEDGLDTVLEVPVPEEIFNPMDGSTKSNSWSNVKTWMKCSQVSAVRPAAPLPGAGGGGNSELPLLLNVVGAPLIPLHVENDT
ncbi:hypothetical protein EJ110_NYTH48924 [Nymphaea thermarum]|nr:hypothetical protein EJ110_NYTH48924 [Nymphaea thermarum]